MNLLTSNVDLDSIHIKSAPFDPTDQQAEIETLAHTIAELQGLLKIPVVRKLGIDEYELVAGHLEYYAFLKAREIDEELPDQLTVFILKPNNEKAILKQLEASQTIQQATTSPNKSPQSDATLTLKVSNLESRSEQTAKQISAEIAQLKTEMLSNLESRFEQTAKQISTEIAQLKTEMFATTNPKLPHPLSSLTDTELPQSLSPLAAFNQIGDPITQKQVLRKLTISLGDTKAEKIVTQLQEYRTNPENAEFRQPSDVRQALKKGTLSPEKLLKVIRQWDS